MAKKKVYEEMLMCLYGCGTVVGLHNTSGICRNCRRKAARKALKQVKRKLSAATPTKSRSRHVKKTS